MTEDSRIDAFRRALGPGILFAAAAIGVSHLNQATRAGAVEGLGLVGVVLLAHLFKVPALLAGPRYAAATGTSLLQAYRDQGRFAVVAFGLLTLGTMFTIQAAVTVVTAAIVQTVLLVPQGIDASLVAVSASILLIGAALFAAGGFNALDRTMKVLMLVLAVSTLVVAAVQLPALPWDTLRLFPPVPAEAVERAAFVAFVVALVGWMPAPLDISVWHSLWTLERRRRTGCDPTVRGCTLDFTVGYVLCAVLALAFLSLGAAELFVNGVSPAAGAGAFARQLIELYTASLGDWARPVIGTCAVAVMLSTTWTVLDALPRTATRILSSLRTDEHFDPTAREAARTRSYWIVLAVLFVGALLLVGRAGTSGFQALIDLATTLSFLGTPVLAFLNHRATVSAAVPEAHRPGPVGRALAVIGIIAWTAFATIFLWQRFGAT